MSCFPSLQGLGELSALQMLICQRSRLLCEEVLRLIDSILFSFRWHSLGFPCLASTLIFVASQWDLGGCDGFHLYLGACVLLGRLVANGSKEPPTAPENRLHEGRFCF